MSKFDKFKPAAGSEDAQRLIDACEASARASERVAALKVELEQAEEEMNRWNRDVIPTLLDQMRVTGKSTFGRFQVVAKDELKGSLPGDVVKRASAIAWLDANGHGDVVERQLISSFPREETSLMLAAREAVLAVAPRANIKDKFDVPHQTLKKLARELRTAGQECPLERLGLIVFREAEVKRL